MKTMTATKLATGNHNGAGVRRKTFGRWRKESASIVVGFVLMAVGALMPSLNGAQLGFAPNGATAAQVSTLQVELGTRFSVTEPLAVAGFAYYDFGSDGFVNPHAVTLWDDVGNFIASVTVSSSSQLVGPSFGGGQFRFENVALTLSPGTYRLSGARSAGGGWPLPPDPDAILVDNSSPDGDLPWAAPGITYLGRVYAGDGTGAGVFPNNVLVSPSADDWFGANLILVNEVPEPSTTVLVLVAAATVWARRRRSGTDER